MTVEMIYYDWTPESMLEVSLPEPDNFLKVRETLTRIGIASRKENKLYQSCHILHKQGRYFIVHFKELFLPETFQSAEHQAEIAKEGYRKYDTSPGGKRILVGSTTELTIKGFAIYLQQVEAFGANLGVIYSANPNEAYL